MQKTAKKNAVRHKTVFRLRRNYVLGNVTDFFYLLYGIYRLCYGNRKIILENVVFFHYVLAIWKRRNSPLVGPVTARRWGPGTSQAVSRSAYPMAMTWIKIRIALECLNPSIFQLFSIRFVCLDKICDVYSTYTHKLKLLWITLQGYTFFDWLRANYFVRDESVTLCFSLQVFINSHKNPSAEMLKHFLSPTNLYYFHFSVIGAHFGG